MQILVEAPAHGPIVQESVRLVLSQETSVRIRVGLPFSRPRGATVSMALFHSADAGANPVEDTILTAL